MIVYVETNFILELALRQEQHAACRNLLNLVAGHPGSLEIALPTYCVGEALEAWGRKRKERLEAHETALRTMDQVARSAPYRAKSKETRRRLNALIVSSTESQERELDRILEEVTRTARLLPVTTTTPAEAQRLRKSRSFRRSQDAMVYAAVLSDLGHRRGSGHACFVTRDRRDFHTNPDVRDDLRTAGCALLSRFPDALGWARSALR